MTDRRCRCAHAADMHHYRHGAWVCSGSVVCGCARYRPHTGNPWPPADHRDGYQPDDTPRRVDMGAHQPTTWPDTEGDA